jgi:trehalose 6-phosphate phosphatase
VPVVARASEAALFVDYDGTLAPIVTDPAGAGPLPGASAVLGRLAQHFGTVAVVSGRPVAYLVDALGDLPGVHVAGLYGLEERRSDGAVEFAADVARWRVPVEVVTRRAQADAPDGLVVEPKGVTVTLHWRTRPEREAWAEDFAARVSADTGLVVQHARMALELRPPVPADKGTVVRRLAEGRPAAACFGDDVGDLPAFAALAVLAAQGVAVARVAVVDDESPAEILDAADATVDGPSGAVALLEALAASAAGAA